MNIKETYAVINRMRADGVITNYAVGGAVGATFYLEPAQTYDVDVFVVLHPKPGQMIVTLQDIHTYLEVSGYRMNPEGYFVVGGYPVQFLPADGPLLTEALERSEEQDYDGVPVRVFAPEYLAAIALSVNRGKDKIRLQQFRQSENFPVRKFMDLIERYGLADRWQRFLEQMES